MPDRYGSSAIMRPAALLKRGQLRWYGSTDIGTCRKPIGSLALDLWIEALARPAEGGKAARTISSSTFLSNGTTMLTRSRVFFRDERVNGPEELADLEALGL